ncbi:MAG: ATP-binding protein [Myxococcota bacterium]
MRLRTTLALAFVALSVLQVAAVAPFALKNLSSLLLRQQDTRIEGVMSSVQAALQRTSADARRAMDELASSEALEKVARDLRKDPPPPHLASVAESLMRPRGLSVLSLFDEQGRTLSSGHLPARLGDPDEQLFSTTSAGGDLVPVMVELRNAAGLRRAPALVSARAVEYGDKKVWAVGGVLLDEALAHFVSNLAGARVEVWAEGAALATAGQAQAPTVERVVPFPPTAELKLAFSRADLFAAQAQMLRAFALLFGIGLALAVLGGLFVARRVTRPVESLTAAASKIAAGALDTKVEEKASGEIGELVRTFNRMTSDLKATTEQLVASERVAAWQEVARRLAHELKNPLTPIRMSLETLLAATDANSPRFQALFKESAGAMLEEVERLRRIVDEFSRFARLPKPQLAELDLGELAAQVLSLFTSPPEGVQLSQTLQPNVVVSADRDQLTQVLLNLIKNAGEAMPRGGRIEVRVKAAGEEAVLEVEDTGPGVKPEDRARLFEPYFTTKEGGTGLGLAIAARICQEHRGRLEVGGEVGKGAVFSVVLPRRASARRD